MSTDLRPGADSRPAPSIPTLDAEAALTNAGAAVPTTASGTTAGAGYSRRGFLRAAALTGGGLVATAVAACAPAAAAPNWTFGPQVPAGATGQPAATATPPPSATPGASMDHPTPAASGSPGPSASTPPGWSAHDVEALDRVQRFLGGEYDAVPGKGNQPLEPRVEADGTKVFELTIDEIDHQLDAVNAPLAALGFNRTWPGPLLRVVEGDRVRATFRNNLPETTGIHFHGQRVPNAMDGVPLITQDPIVPGASFSYEFVAQPAGSHMYHSHHNATDQVGRGLLGAFIVDPADPAERYVQKYGVTQDIVWISNDTLGGFTINGRGFPATAPIVARLGEKIVIRFMNEGLMMHPWHLHGMPMRVIARDGWPLGGAEFTCDTLGVNPGERWDVLIDCDAPGAWAFHCHILTHAEGQNGMFGMVTALVVTDGTAATLPTAAVATARAAGVSTAFGCALPVA